MSLNQLRDTSISTPDFRHNVADIARKLAAKQSYDEATLIVILRSGLALLPSFLDRYPTASIGFFGIERTRDASPRLYFENVPTPTGRVIILDPMCATGGTAMLALERLGVDEATIVGLLIATPGKEAIQKK